MLHYILFAITSLFLLFFAYIKLKYPFWNNQPVFHVYDFIRRFYREPFIVNKNSPIKTKYCDFENIITHKFVECSQKTKIDLINITQCFYLNTDRILYTMSEKDIYALLTGQNEPSYVSIFYEKQYKQVFDASGSRITSIVIPNGSITSRSLRFWYVNTADAHHYTEMPIYLIDLLCVDRQKDRLSIYRKLFQTQEYNQRIENKAIQCSLIKKEMQLFDGIIPFVQYNTHTYKLRNHKISPLPIHYHCVNINSENIDLFIDFFYTNNDYCSKTEIYKHMVFPDIGNIHSLLKQRLLYIYCLKKGEHVYGYYFFKDAKMYYEEVDGNTLQLTCSVMNCLSPTIFYSGYLHSIRDILKKNDTYSMLLFEDIGHNHILLKQWSMNYTPVFTNKTAYYLHNFIMPGSPIAQKDVFILQ